MCPAVMTILYFMFPRSYQCLHYNEHWGGCLLKRKHCRFEMHQGSPRSTIKPCSLSNPDTKQASSQIILWPVNETSSLLSAYPQPSRSWGARRALTASPHVGGRCAVSGAFLPSVGTLRGSGHPSLAAQRIETKRSLMIAF